MNGFNRELEEENLKASKRHFEGKMITFQYIESIGVITPKKIQTDGEIKSNFGTLRSHLTHNEQLVSKSILVS